MTENRSLKIITNKTILFIASGCWLGRIPFLSGTFGTLVGIPICFILSKISLPVSITFMVVFIFFSIWISQKAEKIIRKKDPSMIVIDEIVGMTVSLFGIQFNLFTVFLGFMIFRIFDIIKVFPISTVEKKVKGGAGIVLDDVTAGIMSNIILRIILLSL